MSDRRSPNYKSFNFDDFFLKTFTLFSPKQNQSNKSLDFSGSHLKFCQIYSKTLQTIKNYHIWIESSQLSKLLTPLFSPPYSWLLQSRLLQFLNGIARVDNDWQIPPKFVFSLNSQFSTYKIKLFSSRPHPWSPVRISSAHTKVASSNIRNKYPATQNDILEFP